jgi:hypothetical protein
MAKTEKAEPRMYVGTYSDHALIKSIRKTDHFSTKGMTDKQLQNDINRGVVFPGMLQSITFFFAPTLSKAFKQANEMDLKNFSVLSKTIYESGTDF